MVDEIPVAKIRSITDEDRDFVKNMILTGRIRWYQGIRDYVARQRGLSLKQVSAIKMHLENSGQI